MTIGAENGSYERTLTKAANQAAGTLYYPGPTVNDPGIDHAGFASGSWFISAVCGGGDTQTFTVQISDDGTTWIDTTKSAYDNVTGQDQAAAYVCPLGGSLTAKLDLDSLNARFIRLKNVVTGAASNSAVVIYRDRGGPTR